MRRPFLHLQVVQALADGRIRRPAPPFDALRPMRRLDAADVTTRAFASHKPDCVSEAAATATATACGSGKIHVCQRLVAQQCFQLNLQRGRETQRHICRQVCLHRQSPFQSRDLTLGQGPENYDELVAVTRRERGFLYFVPPLIDQPSSPFLSDMCKSRPFREGATANVVTWPGCRIPGYHHQAQAQRRLWLLAVLAVKTPTPHTKEVGGLIPPTPIAGQCRLRTGIRSGPFRRSHSCSATSRSAPEGTSTGCRAP